MYEIALKQAKPAGVSVDPKHKLDKAQALEGVAG